MRAKRQVKVLDTAEYISRNPVFTLADLRRELGSGVRERAAIERVHYHLKRGRLKAVLRGVYAAVPPGVRTDVFKPDRYLVAAAVRPDSVFSHHAALELLGAAHSEWNVCSAFSARRHATVELDDAKLMFIQDPPFLVRAKKRFLGARETVREGRTLWTTGPERTLLDGFRQPRVAGGLAELVESAEGFGVLDLELLGRLLETYQQKALYAATGWFLERNRRRFSVPEDYLEALRKKRPRSPHYLPRGQRQGGTLVPGWNLVLPVDLKRLRGSDEG